jgi:adenylosuccinate synthase
MKIIAVIGAAFGDEGKGRMTDYFVSANKAPSIVVRYNGGAQAGHTVCVGDKTHTFHHFGSGVFGGAHTYLSRFFIANPMLYVNEYQDLALKGFKPVTLCNMDMPISTPYDMMLNRELELHRGKNRHGSCGYGISETIHRLCTSKYKLFAKDAVCNPKQFRECVKEIRKKWIHKRLSEMKITKPSESFKEAVSSDKIFDNYMSDSSFMVNSLQFESIIRLAQYETIVFEGSQGLGLDERHRFFPHVSRSKTGIDNIQDICRELSIKEIDVCYVTRAYTTRHGNGPLPTEDLAMSFDDPTNIENLWQGKMRFGCLDLDLIAENIKLDRRRAKIKISPSIAVTCMDQIGGVVKIKFMNSVIPVEKQNLPEWITKATGISKIILSSKNHR